MTHLTQCDGRVFSLHTFLDLSAAMAVITAAATGRTPAQWMSRGAYRAAPVTRANVAAALAFARRPDLQGHLNMRAFTHSTEARAARHITAAEAWLAAQEAWNFSNAAERLGDIMTMTAKNDVAMTAAEIRRHCEDVAAVLGGGKADVKLWISAADRTPNFVTVMLCPGGVNDPSYHFEYGDTYRDALAKARDWAQANRTTYRDKLIHRMALAVIDITHEHGQCSEALLRARNFDDADIAVLHGHACARASEMAGGMPFAVAMAQPAAEVTAE